MIVKSKQGLELLGIVIQDSPYKAQHTKHRPILTRNESTERWDASLSRSKYNAHVSDIVLITSS